MSEKCIKVTCSCNKTTVVVFVDKLQVYVPNDKSWKFRKLHQQNKAGWYCEEKDHYQSKP